MAGYSSQSKESKEFELEELKSYNFCCKDFRIFTTDVPYKFVRYFPERRIFGIRDGAADSCIYNLIRFCPWCSRYLGDPIHIEYKKYIKQLNQENQEDEEDYVSASEMTLEQKKEWVNHYKEREKANSAELVSAKEKD